MSWDELVAAALIGTDRREVDAAPPPGAPEELAAALAQRGAEERVLASAAAWAIARRAGARSREPVAVVPAGVDERALCPPAAAVRLRALLDVRAAELVREWLARAEEIGVRPPPELVPGLLDVAGWRAELLDAAARAAGPLGAWLAEREPRWAAARAGDPADLWAAATPDLRRLLFERWRRSDPDTARELLATTFADEPWEEREYLVEQFETGISAADEPFLEAALDDPRKAVREAAGRRLAHLPDSAFAGRMAERVRALVRVGEDELVVELPGPPDEAAKRDGVDPRGSRAHRLRGLLAAAPLSLWEPAVVSLPVGDDLAETVHGGWVVAAARQGNAEWGRVLWPVTREVMVLGALPRAEAEALVAALPDPFEAARALEGQWGPELSRAIVKAIPAHLAKPWRERIDHFVGHRLHPSVEPELEPLRELGGPEIRTLCDTLATRAAILRELR